MKHNSQKIGSIIICLLIINQAISQPTLSNWKAVVGTVTEKEWLGRKALHVSRGLAYLPASTFYNGVIEVDIAGAVMAGLTFRVNANHDYDEAYLRFPKSGGLDAVQYGPVFNGEFSWQFHPEYQAQSSFRPNEWTHLKILVIDRQAAVFINNDTAALYVDSLRAPNAPGSVGVWSLSTGAYFSNFTYRELSPADKLPVIPRKIFSNPVAIKEWWISDPVEFTTAPEEILPENFRSGQNWKKTVTDPDGYLNINKYAKKKTWGMGQQNSTDIVWLRYDWDENSDGIKPISFEYANRCFIYLNNKKIFAGNNSFLLKGAFFRGDIDKQMRANTLFLPIKKGKNSLLVAVAASGNGWGFMGQMADGSSKKNRRLFPVNQWQHTIIVCCHFFAIL